MYTLGLGLGLQLTVHEFLPRLGGVRTLVFGLLLLLATYVTIFYIWTPTTPTVVLAPAIFLQGFCIAPGLIAAGNAVATVGLDVRCISNISMAIPAIKPRLVNRPGEFIVVASSDIPRRNRE